LIWNGGVVATLSTGADRRSSDVRGKIAVGGSGWMLLRAWNDGPDPAVMDIYPYATTSPIYVRVGDRPRRSGEAATYFLRWLDRIEANSRRNQSYRTTAEREAVLRDVSKARALYETCAQEASPADR